MIITARHLRIPALIGIFLLTFLSGCAPLVPDQNTVNSDHRRSSTLNSEDSLTPAQAYAAEVLSYLLQVVVGYAGPHENRHAWRTAGDGSELSYRMISKIMTDPEYRKTDLIVLDASLLGLSEVLYRYEPLFNQFKGRYVFDSVYPSSELIAIRLLILRKLSRGEQINLSAMRDREALFQPDAEDPLPADLSAMNLSADEFQLIKDVFISEPRYLEYYRHPFIVEGLTRIGFFKKDGLTKSLTGRASYRQYAADVAFDKLNEKQVNIVILPSLTGEFQFGESYVSPYVLGFKPTSTYLRIGKTLQSDIVARTADLLRAGLQNGHFGRELDEDAWKSLWARRYLPMINIRFFEQKPLSIYPENADRVLEGLCAGADLTVIVLGKNVYRTLDFNAGDDDMPAAGRIYLDIEDIGLNLVDDQIDNIARFVADRLMQFPLAAAGDTTAFNDSP